MALDNLGLAHWFAARSWGRALCEADRDEIRSACRLALCLAAQRYDPGRGRFLDCLKWAVREQLKALGIGARPAGMKNSTRHPDVPSTVCVPPGDAAVLLDARFYAVDEPAAD